MKLTATQTINIKTTKVSILCFSFFLFISNNANAQCGVSSNQWCILGNTGTTAGTNYVGTFDFEPLVFKTFNTEWMRISTTGNVGIFTITPAYKLDVGGDINLTGALRIGTFEGTAGQVLTSAGGGANTWTTPTNGTVTSVIGIAPIISSGGTAPDISITQAGISANGFLSSTDWNIFNNKVTGSGTIDYIPKWTPDGATLGNSSIFDNGSVGIGTTNPLAKFQVNNGTVLFDGVLDNTSPVNGSGTRMMWIPSKAAFRAGVVTGTTWDYANVGTTSTAFGYNTQANGYYSSAWGYGSIAQSYNSFVIGQYNVVSGTPQLWVATEPLFVIGNGVYNDGSYGGPKAGGIVRNNALTVLKNGNVGIATTTPKNKLDVQGGIAIGNSYAGIKVAPTNGAIIRGKVGIGTATPKNQLDVQGGVAIGATYSGIKVAPANGAIIQGNVGIGVTNPVNKLEVCGTIRSNEWIVETGWCDYKLTASYVRMGWQEKLEFILKYGHLPDIDPGYVIEKKGLQVAKTMKGFISNIEDNTMDIITLYKENQEQKNQIDYLIEENNILKIRLDEIDKKLSKK